ncbi:MAG TPA: hypothetical protein VGH62_00820, partial [Bradyrhizobium sp.]
MNFEQLIATMPISDYASAFFFARRDRVTLKRSAKLSRWRDCYFKNTPGQQSASFHRGRAGLLPAAESARQKCRRA